MSPWISAGFASLESTSGLLSPTLPLMKPPRSLVSSPCVCLVFSTGNQWRGKKSASLLMSLRLHVVTNLLRRTVEISFSYPTCPLKKHISWTGFCWSRCNLSLNFVGFHSHQLIDGSTVGFRSWYDWKCYLFNEIYFLIALYHRCNFSLWTMVAVDFCENSSKCWVRAISLHSIDVCASRRCHCCWGITGDRSTIKWVSGPDCWVCWVSSLFYSPQLDVQWTRSW